jgi:hypothetical protein
MKRIALCLITLLILMVAVPAFAASSTLTGTITGNQGSTDTVDVGCVPYNSGLVFYYEVYTIRVSEAGKYGLFDTNNGVFTAFPIVYPYGGFDPANPTANCIFADNGSAATFAAAGLYTLVVSTTGPGEKGNFSFTFDGPGSISFVEESNACTQSLPAGSSVRPVPNGAPAYYDADPATLLPFSLPAGTWWISETSGDFAKVWIGCDANPVWISLSAVAP